MRTQGRLKKAIHAVNDEDMDNIKSDAVIREANLL
jgi:hypothetical protein